MLEEISGLTGQGKATLASELIDAALPALQANIQALRIVKEAPREAQRLLARYGAEAVMALQQTQLELDDLISESPRQKRQKRKRGSDGPT